MITTARRKRLVVTGVIGVVVLAVAAHVGLGGAVFAAPSTGWVVGVMLAVVALKVGAIVVAGRHRRVFHGLARFGRSKRDDTSIMRAEGRVLTPKGERYAKQLCSHAAWKTPHATWTPPNGVIEFPDGMGTCRMTAEPDQLILEVEAAGSANLKRIQGIIGDNIERFGGREELTVEWVHGG